MPIRTETQIDKDIRFCNESIKKNGPPGYAAWFDPKNQPKERKKLTDAEFKQLQEDIKASWTEYERLQDIHRRQTGGSFIWFK